MWLLSYTHIADVLDAALKADVGFLVGAEGRDNVLCMTNVLSVFVSLFYCYEYQSRLNSRESEPDITV